MNKELLDSKLNVLKLNSKLAELKFSLNHTFGILFLKPVTVSKFIDIKSDMQMPIPMEAQVEFLCEGPNRDGVLDREALEESLEGWEDKPIIDFHDMSDMSKPTPHKISDRKGYLGKPTLTFRDGKMWISSPALITDRALAYQLYLNQLKNKPLEISPEYGWTAKYANGKKYQTNLVPHLLSIVDRGHIKGNTINIKDVKTAA